MASRLVNRLNRRACAHAAGLVATLLPAAAPLFSAQAQDTKLNLRASAVPLVTHDPFFSIWSRADKLTDTHTSHWTGNPDTLTGLVRVDGKAYRVLGEGPSGVPAMEQIETRVWPTRTVCTFKTDEIKLTLTFLSPILPDDLVLMSTPISTVVWEVESLDGKSHNVSGLLTASGDITVGNNGQAVIAETVEGLDALRIGRSVQPVLVRSGDQIPIDWGHLYLSGDDATLAIGPAERLHNSFAHSGKLPQNAQGYFPRPVNADQPSVAASIDFGKVGNDTVTKHLLLGYDDTYSIEYRGAWLKGFWAKDGATFEATLARFEDNIDQIIDRCESFDKELMTSLTEVGGERYALMAALAHRQSIAGGKLCADANGMPLWFPKENSSNGCIATTDVFYPQIPHLLFFNNDLAKATVVPILDYAASDSWKFDFAPHDLGTYPLANRQAYGGGERTEENQMPVEESGNMLLICGAITQLDGNADFASRWWPTLTQWANYLAEHGIDPGNQLSTDDFTGHLARNVNLSVKALEGMAAYAMIAEVRGDQATADRFNKIVADGVAWMIKTSDAGDHHRLTFNPDPSWSQKYNLVWDEVLNLNAFPAELIDKEVAYYLTKLNEFGLPLDSRSKFTKTDWNIWTATLTDNREDFDAMVDPVFRFVNETPDRVPFSDWFWTDSGKVRGFIARPVIGGVFMPMLKDRDVWEAWANKAKPTQGKADGQWAPFPNFPETVTLVPSSEDRGQVWQFTFDKPEGDWFAKQYNTQGWKRGRGGFGTPGTPSSVVRTVWNTNNIWLRREINIPEYEGEIRAYIHHDEDAMLYLDGEPLVEMEGFTGTYRLFRLPEDAQAKLTPGKHTLAVHVRQSNGGQYFDVGFVQIKEAK